MPSIVKLKIPDTAFTFECQFFDELVAGPHNPKGRLPRDLGAHALWYYYCLAFKNMKEAQANIVYESERSKKFDVPLARRLLERIAFQYGFKPGEITRYWEAVEAQRLALGYTENADLPHALKFRFN